jgi:hypothetical protein
LHTSLAPAWAPAPSLSYLLPVKANPCHACCALSTIRVGEGVGMAEQLHSCDGHFTMSSIIQQCTMPTGLCAGCGSQGSPPPVCPGCGKLLHTPDTQQLVPPGSHAPPHTIPQHLLFDISHNVMLASIQHQHNMRRGSWTVGQPTRGSHIMRGGVSRSFAVLLHLTERRTGRQPLLLVVLVVPIQ